MNFKLQLLIILLINVNGLYSQKTVLWKIERKGSEKISYLFGTLHQTGNSFVDARPKITELLSHADMAVFESVEDKNKTIVDVINKRPDNYLYKEYMDKNDVQFLEEIAKDWVVPLSKLYPAELALKLEQLYILDVCETAKPGDTWKHLDDYLMSLAEKGHVTTEGLETSQDQFKAINAQKQYDDWPKAKNEIAFRIARLRLKDHKDDLCRVPMTYLGNMNFDYQFKAKCAEDNPLFIKRNQAWTPKIAEIVEDHNAFIAVGLAHLFGNCGLITQLREMGYKVTPVSIPTSESD